MFLASLKLWQCDHSLLNASFTARLVTGNGVDQNVLRSLRNSVVVHDVDGGAGLDGEAGGAVHAVGQCMLSVG